MRFKVSKADSKGSAENEVTTVDDSGAVEFEEHGETIEVPMADGPKSTTPRRGSKLAPRGSVSSARASVVVDPQVLVSKSFLAADKDTEISENADVSLQFDPDDEDPAGKHKQGTFLGVYLPTCETMWGVLIYIKFGNIVGHAGILLSLAITWASALIVALTATSVSALATNGKVSSQGPGGVYYILTRSLGPSIGGSVGVMYFIGLSVMAAVELVGFCEGVHAVVVAETGHGVVGSHNHYYDQLAIATPTLLVVGGCLLLGDKIVHMIGLVILVVLLASYAAALVGLFLTAGGWATGPGITGLSAQTFVDNLLPDFTDGWHFNTAVTYLFPCFLGIFYGTNVSKSLKRPNKSIPLGAFGAIATSLVLYTVILCLLGAVADRQTLKTNTLLFCDCAWPNRWVAIAGLLVVGIGAGMQLLAIAPGVLRDIAADSIVPLLGRLHFERTNSNGLAVRGLVLSMLIAFPFLFAPNLDLVATVVTMAFLLNYAAVNLTCSLLSILNLHSWRPKFRYYHGKLTAALGCVLAVTLMFEIAWYLALGAIAIFGGLCAVIELNSDSKIWGSGVKGLQLSMAFESLINLEQEESSAPSAEQAQARPGETQTQRAWSPQFLVLVGHHTPDTDPTAGESSLMRFTAMLNRATAKSTFVMVGTVLVQEEGVSYQAEAREAQARKQLLQQLMQRHGLRGLTEVAMAPSVGVGLTTMLQMAGLGTLRPNTVVAGWPQHATAERAADVVSLLQMSRAVNKACMFVKAQDDYLPADDARLSGTVDLWWILQEGGFLLLIGYLLHRHKVYRNCTLRLFTVAELTGSPAAIERQLEALLRALRIKCVVRVVEMPTSQLHTFMNQWTISRNMAQQAAQQLKVANQEALAFPATVDQLSGVAHNHPAESELLAAAPGDDEMWSLDQLAGAIGRESSQAALVIVNLPVPGVQDDEQPLKYVEMVNRLVSTIPTCVLVSGLSDGTQAISVYQQ